MTTSTAAGCAPTATDEICALLKMPQEVHQLHEQVDGLVEHHGRFVAKLEQSHREGSASLQGMRNTLEEVHTAVIELTARQDCLEEASRQQTLLTEAHFFTHVVDPVARDILELLDFTEGMTDSLRKSYQSDNGFEVFGEKLRGLLARLGVEQAIVEHGDAFSPSSMQALCYDLNCTDPALDKRVCRVRKQGFHRGDRVIRHATVELYRFRGTTERESDQSQTYSNGGDA